MLTVYRILFLSRAQCGYNSRKSGLKRGDPHSEPNSATSNLGSRRIGSIDLVRGLAMVVMALDHTRDFICNIPFEPEDIDKTWTFYFLVRWVTHFCAPAFFLLAGVGAYLYGARHSPAALQWFLVTRGFGSCAGVHAHRLCLDLPSRLGHVRSHLLPWTFHDSVGGFCSPAARPGPVCSACCHRDSRFVRRTEACSISLRPMAAVHAASQRPCPPGRGTALRFVSTYSLVRRNAARLRPGPLFERNSATARRTLLWAGTAAMALFVICVPPTLTAIQARQSRIQHPETGTHCQPWRRP